MGHRCFAQFTLQIRYDIDTVFDKISPMTDKISPFMDGTNLIWKHIITLQKEAEAAIDK